MSKRNFNRNFAIIIGINDYINGIPKLKTAVPDAEKLAQIIEQQHLALKQQYQAGNKYEVLLIKNQSATLNQLKVLIEELKNKQIPFDNKKVTVTEDDRVLFYFAGHGIAEDALESQEGPVGYLIPQDATDDNSTFLPMQELHDALNALPCKHMLAILDCCFAGAFRWASVKRQIVPKSKVYKERYDRFISDAAWQVITSAAYDQKALDSLGKRGIITDGNEEHSPFAKALFDALLGKGVDSGKGADPNQDAIITATELYLYLRNQVEIYTKNNYKRQTPSLCPLKKHDKGEFIFLLPNFDRDKLDDAPALSLKNNPYRGLESYDEKDSPLFFGRDKLKENLSQIVIANKQPLTLILGASGTGKSSLMKAGLLSYLRNCQEPKFEILEPIRPGENPLKVLAQILPVAITAEELAKNEQALVNIIEHWSNKNPHTRLLLPIDQFEELITLCKSDEEKEQFQKLIRNALKKFPQNIHIVVTLRLDFEAQFQNSILKDFWNHDTRFIITPMSQNEFREAIEKPASEKVIYFDPPSLVDELINEVIQMPGALPLLSFTLSELYLKYLSERRNNRALTKKDYEELGGVVGSLTKRADQEYEKLVAENPAYQDTVRRVMLRLISLQGGELARRQVLQSELVYSDGEENKRVQTVITRFSEARLIVVGSNSEGKAYVEPAHDALVRGWTKLRNWINNNQERLALQQNLTPVAVEWATNKQESGYLWTEDPRLAVLEKIIEADAPNTAADNWLNQLETNFIKRSIRKKEEEYINEKKQIINLFSRASQAFFASNQDLEALIEAVKGGKEFQILRNKLKKLQDKAILEGNEAAVSKDIDLQSQILQTLRKVFYLAKERNRIELPQDFKKMFFASDGTLLIATAGHDSIVYLQDLKGEKQLKIFSGHQGELTLNVSQNGRLLAAIDEQGTIRLWNLEGKQEEAPKLVTSIPQSSYSDVYDRGIGFSPDGKQLVAYVDGLNKNDNVEATVFLWNLLESEPKLLKTSQKVLSGISFNPQNQLIVATQSDDTLFLSDFVSGKKLAKFTDFYGSLFGSLLNNFVFSSDSQYLVAYYGADMSSAYFGSLDHKSWDDFTPINRASSIIFDASGNLIIGQEGDGIISVYNPSFIEDSFSKGLQFDIKGHQGSILEVIACSDGKHFASLSSDNTIRLWDVGQKPVAELRQIPNLISISISPDGEQLAVVQSDGTVCLLDLNANELKRFGGIQGKIIQLIFSPDGRQLAAVGKDSTISLLDMNGKELYKSPSFKKTISQLIFRPDGQQLAVVENNGIIHLLNLNNKTWETLPGKVSPNDKFEGTSRIVFTSDGRLLVANSPSTEYYPQEQGNIFLSELGAGKRKELVKFKGAINSFKSIGLNSQGNLLVSAYGDDIYVWDMSGKLLTTFKDKHKGQVNSISLSADGSLLVTLSSNGTAKLWLLGGLNELLQQGCAWVRDYVENNLPFKGGYLC